ncbi:unnamed protein product [Calypogeia fissa]
MEGIRTVKVKVAAYVHPSRAADVPQGVHEILNSLLLRFNEQFEGVILAYLSPKLVGHTAKILSGLNPYFHVTLTAKLLLFSPAPGMKIEGKVNKIEKDYIGVVVLGLFNTTIGVDDIRDDLEYSTTHHLGRAWISKIDNRHIIELGSLIRFSVKSLQETEHIIDICGSLSDNDTGSVDWLDQHSFRSRNKG